MSDRSKEKETRVGSVDVPGDRLVYVLPEHAVAGRVDDEVSLSEVLVRLWRGRWIIIATTVTFAIASVAYALVATEWYRAEVLLIPAEETSTPSLGGELGGLAALAGVSIESGDSVESVAVLRSREFAREFIGDLELTQVFFAEKWDGENNRWLGDDPEERPDIRSAVEYFHKQVLSVVEDSQTGLVTLAVEWTDPEVSAEWARELVSRLNARLRQRALGDAEANVAYLQEELAKTNVVTLQQTIGRLLETELQKLMLAQGNDEFAFRVIDGANAPRYPERPNRPLIVVLGTMLGGLLGVSGVFVVYALRAKPDSSMDRVNN